MENIEDLYTLIPEGMFSSKEELAELINSDGLESIYELIPEGMFSSKEEFISEFDLLKKKTKNIPRLQLEAMWSRVQNWTILPRIYWIHLKTKLHLEMV